MRLLNTQSWKLKEFISDDEIPRYAILSHTWDEEEVNFQQWERKEDVGISHMKGYKKIVAFGCCIDKKSSAELTEAINAMFQWYKNAAVCFVHLSDASCSSEPLKIHEILRGCRWFTRGWTLQELLAPSDVEFYSRDWQRIATKTQLSGVLSSITGIDEHILLGGDLAGISIARRMSWASQRKTARREDIAYCLLGIFDVSLPLIYGEGHKAFQRLQEAIMNTTHDQSLFAWGTFVGQSSDMIDRDQELGLKPIPWKSAQERQPQLGLFARSPADFAASGDVSPVDHPFAHWVNRNRPPVMVNGGALLDLVIHKKVPSAAYWDALGVAYPYERQVAVLLCRVGKSGSQLVGLILHPWGDGYFSRTEELLRVNLFVSHFRFQKWTELRHVLPERPFQLCHGDIVIRRWSSPFEYAGATRPVTKNGPAWRQRYQGRVLRLDEEAAGSEDPTFYMEVYRGQGVAVTLRRVSGNRKDIGQLSVGISHFETNGSGRNSGVDMPNWVLKNRASAKSPQFAHVMQLPSDVWELCEVGMARLSATVERMRLRDGSGEVDVLDLYLRPHGSQFTQESIGVFTLGTR